MLEAAMLDFIRATEAAFPADAASRSHPEQRRLYDAWCARSNPPLPAGVEAHDQAIPGPGGAVPVRVYRRPDRPLRGSLLYLHGGGFVLGGLDSHAFYTAHLAARLPLAVVAVDYRLAPEHPYPAARDDVRTVLERLQSDPGSIDAAPGALIVGGDSAGGNLAAGLTLYNRDRGGPPLAGQFLSYPLLAAEPLPPSRDADAPLLSLADVLAYRRLYHGDAPPLDDPYAFPLAATELCDLPPALLLPVEHDPLRDEAVAYAERLRAAGVATTLHLGRGLVHGCLRALGRSPGVDAMDRCLLDWLGEQLTNSSDG